MTQYTHVEQGAGGVCYQSVPIGMGRIGVKQKKHFALGYGFIVSTQRFSLGSICHHQDGDHKGAGDRHYAIWIDHDMYHEGCGMVPQDLRRFRGIFYHVTSIAGEIKMSKRTTALHSQWNQSIRTASSSRHLITLIFPACLTTSDPRLVMYDTQAAHVSASRVQLIIVISPPVRYGD